METLQLTIPSLYADHHTIAVRQILEQIEGISDLYVSAATHQVSLAFDPQRASRNQIEEALARHGYTVGQEELVFAASPSGRSTRQTAAVATAGSSLAFRESSQSWQAPTLWPCPGLE